MEIRYLFLVTAMAFSMNLQSQTTILKWPEGKQACVTFTYDDGTLNQFEIAVPLMDKHNFKGTFFINTEVFGGSENYATFVGRPITDILNESKTVSTNKENAIWIASFQDAYKYIRERMNCRISESVSREEIMLTLECPLEPETVYNMPLTLKTPVPDEWEMVKIVQNNNIQRKKPVEEENKKFVIYNACPGAYHVSLTNAND